MRTMDKDKYDDYVLCLILNITKSVFSLTRAITLYPMLHPELISSGLVW